MRDGADHLMTAEYDNKRMTTRPVKAVEQYIAVETHNNDKCFVRNPYPVSMLELLNQKVKSSCEMNH